MLPLRITDLLNKNVAHVLCRNVPSINGDAVVIVVVIMTIVIVMKMILAACNKHACSYSLETLGPIKAEKAEVTVELLLPWLSVCGCC